MMYGKLCNFKRVSRLRSGKFQARCPRSRRIRADLTSPLHDCLLTGVPSCLVLPASFGSSAWMVRERRNVSRTTQRLKARQPSVGSLLTLSRSMQFDQSLYYTARLPGGSIPGHARLDLRLSRRMGESVEISLVGQNLLRPRTLEWWCSGVLGWRSQSRA